MKDTPKTIGIWHGIHGSKKTDLIEITNLKTQEEILFEMDPPTKYLERFYYELFRDEGFKKSLGIFYEKPIYTSDIKIDTNSSIEDLEKELGKRQASKIAKTSDTYGISLAVCIKCYLFWHGYIGNSTVDFNKNGVIEVKIIGRLTELERKKVNSKYEKLLSKTATLKYKAQKNKQTRQARYDEDAYYKLYKIFLEERQKNPNYKKSDLIKKFEDIAERSGEQSNTYKTLKEIPKNIGITWD